MRLVIDADVITYRVAWSCEDRKTGEKSPDYVCVGRINTTLEEILAVVKPSTYQLYLSTGKTFRHDMYPEYKSKRPPKPQHYELCRTHMISKWDAQEVTGIEADDAMAIEGATSPNDTCIASIDKDMLQIPCWHYNFVTGKYFKQDEETALRSFYGQILTGDSTDNVPGLRGIGAAKAERALQGATTEEEMLRRCVELYKEHEQDRWAESLLLNGRLVYMLRHLEDKWEPDLGS